MRKTFANYDHCITNFICTISNYFGIKEEHEILENLNRKLKQKKYENIVVINVRGMGANTLKRSLADNAFLRCNKIDEISTTFPSSTTSSNVSLRTGLNPIEHGIINEKINIKKLKNIEDETLVNKINNLKDKNIKAYDFGKEHGKKYKDLTDLLGKINKVLEKSNKKYIYADYSELENIIEEFGCNSKEAIKEIKNINTQIEKFTKKLNDTVVFVVADHGFLDCEPLLLPRYKEVYNMLANTTLDEPRSCHFFIREGKRLDFEETFIKYFGRDFILLSKNECKSKDIFGLGTDHSLLETPIGDYVAVAISEKYYTFDENDEQKSMDAGITEDEIFVPLIMIDKK